MCDTFLAYLTVQILICSCVRSLVPVSNHFFSRAHLGLTWGVRVTREHQCLSHMPVSRVGRQVLIRYPHKLMCKKALIRVTEAIIE